MSQLLILITLFANLCSCSIKKGDGKLPAIGKSVALFDNFTYKGEDDFYNKNQLSDINSFYNPILPGWYSDPSICTNGEGDYFLVTSTFCYFPGVPIFHSRDLVNWKQVGHVLDRSSQLKNFIGQGVSGGIFAPAIEYNPHNKTYYMITTNVGVGNFVVKTQDPFGSWSEPFYLPNVGGIDPSLFFDEDGKAYIVNNDEPEGVPQYDGHRSIRIHEFDVNTDQVVGTGRGQVLVDKGCRPEEKPIWIEGPHLYKINGKYFLMSAEGGTGDFHSEVIFKSDSPLGPFTPWEKNPILTQRTLDRNRPNPITCAGHADLIQTKEGDWWAVFLACRPINNQFENLGRETFLMPVKWSDDGFPYLTQGDDVIPMIVKKEGMKRDDKTTFGNLEEVEEFDKTSLNMSWMTLRTPGADLYSLSETPGYLTLKCAEISSEEKATPAFVCRRMQHHKFVCTTRMLFDPTGEKEAAGLLLFKDETHQYFFSVSNSVKCKIISLTQINQSGNKILAMNEMDGNTKEIQLKVISKGTHYDFYYSLKDADWILLCDNIDASYLSTAVAGGFTGATIGMYATQK